MSGRKSKLEVIVDELEFMPSRHRDGQPQPEPDARCAFADFAADGDLDLPARRMGQLARHAMDPSLQAKAEGAAHGR